MQYTVAMMGYGPEDQNAVLELTYKYGVAKYDKGNAYGQVWMDKLHCLCNSQMIETVIVVSLSGSWYAGFSQIAIGTDDVYKTAEVVKLSGGQVVREPGPLPGIGTKITSVLDPDGWKTVLPCSYHANLQTNGCSRAETQILSIWHAGVC